MTAGLPPRALATWIRSIIGCRASYGAQKTRPIGRLPNDGLTALGVHKAGACRSREGKAGTGVREDRLPEFRKGSIKVFR